LTRQTFQIGGLSKIEKAQSGLKIKLIDSFEPLNQVLRRVFVLVGIRKESLPNQEQTLVLVNFIADNYKANTIDDILIAFEMSIKGELEVDTDHFQQFDAKYFAKIMKSYNVKRAQVLRQMQIQKEKDELDNKKFTTEEINESLKQFDKNCIVKTFELYKETGKLSIPFEGLEKAIFNSLDNRHNVLKLTQEQKHDIFNESGLEVKKELENILKRNSLTNQEKQEKTIAKEILEGKNNSLKKIKCYSNYYKSCISNYFDEIIFDERNILTELNLE